MTVVVQVPTGLRQAKVLLNPWLLAIFFPAKVFLEGDEPPTVEQHAPLVPLLRGHHCLRECAGVLSAAGSCPAGVRGRLCGRDSGTVRRWDDRDGRRCVSGTAPPSAGAAAVSGYDCDRPGEVGGPAGVGRLLMEQALSRHRSSVVRTSDDSSLSSLQFESLFAPHSRFCLHPPLMGRARSVEVMNSCGVMHDARVNSLGTYCTVHAIIQGNMRIRKVVHAPIRVEFRVEQSH